MIAFIVYDISSDRQRNRIAQNLFDMGFIRIQKSAFFGELDEWTFRDIIDNLELAEDDKILFIVTCKKCFDSIEKVGNIRLSIEKSKIFIY